MGMTPISDADLADYAPHIAERAAVEQAEYADLGRDAEPILEALQDLLHGIYRYPADKKDPRKHSDTCFAKHADCLADAVQRLIQNAGA